MMVNSTSGSFLATDHWIMSKSKTGRQLLQNADGGHLAITVTELDRLVYDELVKIGAASVPENGSTEYVITDREKAKSQNILPKILNPLGKKGWELRAVNKMECYVFKRSEPVEYKVLTPPDMDRIGMRLLQEGGHLELSGFEGEIPKLEITSPKDARIQNVLPRVLDEIENDGWNLVAINGPQLYFFTRPTKTRK